MNSLSVLKEWTRRALENQTDKDGTANQCDAQPCNVYLFLRGKLRCQRPVTGGLPPQTASECVSAIGPKDTFDGSAHGKSPCEDDISEGLVDGRVEVRTGVQVESEVVLHCEGYNKESACDMTVV